MHRKHLDIVDELVGKKVSGGCLKLKNNMNFMKTQLLLEVEGWKSFLGDKDPSFYEFYLNRGNSV